MIPFVKMQGIGNDFVMVDAIANPIAPSIDLADLARKTNDRRFGVGGDGLILLERGESAPFRMRMFNPDGSESEMCGNGIRCLARLARDHQHLLGETLDVETGAGTLHLRLAADGQVRVDMGIARTLRGEIPMTGPAEEAFIDQPLDAEYRGTAVSMGNPHVVIFVQDVDSIDLPIVGARLEHSPLFPKRVNVHFVQVLDPGHLRQRTWERGAGATLACGTGACAVAVAGVLTNRSNPDVKIDLPGGSLRIEVQDDFRVLMTGPAETVFEGEWSA